MVTQPRKKQPNHRLFSKLRLTVKQRKIWLSILAAFSLVVAAGGLYGAGYNTGYATANKKYPKMSKELSNLQLPFQPIKGTVDSINGKSLTILTDQGEKKSLTLTTSTRIVMKTEARNVNDLKKKTNVIALTQGPSDNLIATRIMIQNK